jgi:phosphate transport system substrate-binding protein
MTARTAVLLVAALLLGGCAPDNVQQGNGRGDEGIFVSGSSTVEPISARIADAFSSKHPEIAVRVEGPGTGDGFEMFCSGESDISDASRPIKAEEVEKCQAAGIEFAELKVAIDGLSVLTSTTNEVDCLSFADLYALLGPESIGFDNWAEANKLARELKSALDPAEYGEIHAPYPNLELTVTAPGEESGTFDSFTELVLEDISELREEDGLPRPDYQASPNDNVILDGIAGSDGSLGWAGYAFARDNRTKVKILEVDAGKGCVPATPDTIAAGEFPISRALYIYVSLDKAATNVELVQFVDYYLSDEGIANVPEVGYVSLTDADLEATREAWTARRAGPVDGG